MLPEATWYPDPSGRHEHRYWDGRRWTEHVADGGIASIDPFTVKTADEQVDGGMAADIASVALAATSTLANGSSERDRRGTADEQHGDDAEEEPGPAEDDPDLWRDAATFVMPTDTMASLSRPATPARDADAPPPSFTGITSDELDVSRDHGIVVEDRTATIGMSLDGDGLVVATHALRRVVGTCDLDRTATPWARHVVGEGSVTIVAEDRLRVVGLAGPRPIVVATSALVALDGAARIEPARSPVDAVVLAGASWMVVAVEGALAGVVLEGGATEAETIAWSGPLEPRLRGGVLVVSGTGQALVCAG